MLLRLLGADPANQTLPLWLGTTPMRQPPIEEWETNPHFQRAQAGLDALWAMAPTFQDFHPQSPGAADECRFVLNHTFRSPGFTSLPEVPNYLTWIKQADMTGVYERYRRVLNLISDSGQRWVLKCPTHLWHMHALLTAFPDACIVMTHRDPVRSFASHMDLAYRIRQFTERDITATSYGRRFYDVWGWVLDKAEGDRLSIDSARIYDLHADELRKDPAGTVQEIYRYFDLPFSERTVAAWVDRARESPTGGHKTHTYRAEDFGVTDKEIYDCTGRYLDRYRHIVGALSE